MTNVLHFLPVYLPAWQYGGPILSVSRLCEALARLDVPVRVITTNAGLPDLPLNRLGKSSLVNGVEVTYYPVDSPTGVIYSEALVKSLSEHLKWADVLHISSIWQPLGLAVQKAAHESSVPVIHTLRGGLGSYSWRRGWWKKIPYHLLLERPILQRARLIHCTTKLERDELRFLRLRPPAILLPNPVSLEEFYYSERIRTKWRKRFGIEKSQKLLLVAGRMHHKKGLDLLPPLLSRLTQNDWRIIFIGNDDDNSLRKVRKSLNMRGISERAQYSNSLPPSELIGPYNAADCLLLPSRHENFGNVVVEALACGCPTLITPKVGVGEHVKKCPGVQISPRQPELFLQTLIQMLASPRPNHASEYWVKDRFSSQAIAVQAM